MSNTSRLEPLADYAGQVEADAARRLAASSKALMTKEAELAQLRSYLAEYRQRAQQEELSTDSARWQNMRLFLAKLSDAVAHHEAEVATAMERHRLEADRWRNSHQRAQALDKVVERAKRDALHVRHQREQTELDEQASRRARAAH
jgi:flagellar export protein FliJ